MWSAADHARGRSVATDLEGSGFRQGRERNDPHAWLLTVTVLTTDELWRIRDRAPLIVRAEAYGTWLGNDDELRGLLIPATVGMRADPVSAARSAMCATKARTDRAVTGAGSA